MLINEQEDHLQGYRKRKLAAQFTYCLVKAQAEWNGMNAVTDLEHSDDHYYRLGRIVYDVDDVFGIAL